MLKREHRLTDGPSFGRAVRAGRRAGTRTLVVHLAAPEADQAEPRPPRVGLVVGKAVGNAVVRNQVKRRLRHLMRERVTSLPLSALVVVRALPAAPTASYAELGDDLDRALARARTPRDGSRGSGGSRGPGSEQRS
ncbi:ribonuclease P protein component [Nocardioides caldifontis]|uniref:ribonuclease P protein component n=1 Tax=Nocardioides caldifontis TaxID=2588938 RepID=UPI0011DF132E|nr:ribonuclease P protein component [Nocardioides caldifontis]